MRNVFRAVALIYITLICHTALAQEASRYENLVVTGVDLYSNGEYAAAKDSAEVLKIQSEYLE